SSRRPKPTAYSCVPSAFFPCCARLRARTAPTRYLLRPLSMCAPCYARCCHPSRLVPRGLGFARLLHLCMRALSCFDTEVVIIPGESDDEGDDGLVLWLENMLEEPSSPIDRPSCKRDWPKGCGPRAKLKPRRSKTKQARMIHKAKAKEEKCWCKP
ncbi:Unknown protein, partial [Striga hermonthica]